MDLTAVRDYYAVLRKALGPTPEGMNWRDREAQESRFEALLHLFDAGGSVNDWGCGSGEFAEFLRTREPDVDPYIGYDIVEQKLPAYPNRTRRFILSDKPTEVADYTVASGLFNVKLDEPRYRWYEYMLSSIKVMAKMSRKGFAFNCLSTYCDKRDDKLFYAEPVWVLEECWKYSPRVALLHDYSPWDFTVLVRL